MNILYYCMFIRMRYIGLEYVSQLCMSLPVLYFSCFIVYAFFHLHFCSSLERLHAALPVLPPGVESVIWSSIDELINITPQGWCLSLSLSLTHARTTQTWRACNHVKLVCEVFKRTKFSVKGNDHFTLFALLFWVNTAWKIWNVCFSVFVTEAKHWLWFLQPKPNPDPNPNHNMINPHLNLT